jgi:ABC-type uncharacterized transport system auxiliary subunit
MRAARTTTLLAGVLILSSLAGCTIFGNAPPIPDDRYYLLPYDSGPPADHPPLLRGLVAVERPRADGLHSERAMLYIDPSRPLEIRRYHYHFWSDSPPALIQTDMVNYFAHTDFASRVLRSANGVSPDYVVEGRLLRFERILYSDGPKVAVSLQLELSKPSGGGQLWVQTYSEQAKAKGNTMHATVEAYDAALKAIYKKFENDVRAHVTSGA